MKLSTKIAALLFAAWVVPAYATVLGSSTYNGHTYYLLDGKPWLNQEAEAVILGGHLVTISDAAENAWVWDTFGAVNTGLFIGFNDAASEGTFVWSSGDPVTFINWRTGEPNNCCGGEDFGELGGDYKWNDVGPNHAWRAVVEVVPTSVPEPSSLLLMLAAMGSLAVFTKRQ